MLKTLVRTGAVACVLAAAELGAQQADSATFMQLESDWNAAHLGGDTVALGRLWADVLIIEVPEMPAMSKADALAFWRQGRSSITRYETSALQIQIEPDSVLVRGTLFRERDFNGRVVEDRWAFLKVYRRIDGRWRVTAYRASDLPEADEHRLGPSAQDSPSALWRVNVTQRRTATSRDAVGSKPQVTRATLRPHGGVWTSNEGAF